MEAEKIRSKHIETIQETNQESDEQEDQAVI